MGAGYIMTVSWPHLFQCLRSWPSRLKMAWTTCYVRSNTFPALQCSGNVWGLVCWSLFLNSRAVLHPRPQLSPLCPALPISFVPQQDPNRSLAESLRVIVGDTSAVQKRSPFKIDYLKCSWPLRISYWLYFLRLMQHWACLLLSILLFLSSIFKASCPCCPLSSLELPANELQIHVIFLRRQFIFFCFPLSFQAWPRDELCRSARKAQSAAISICS